MGTENRESCSQRDSAERKGYVRAHRDVYKRQVLSAEEITYTEGGALSINITPEQVMRCV